MKKRKKHKNGFQTLLKEKGHTVRDIVIGCAIKTTFCVLAVGIVGVDNFADIIAQISADRMATTVPASLSPDVFNHDMYSTGATKCGQGVDPNNASAELPDGHLHTAAEFKEVHPHMAGAD